MNTILKNLQRFTGAIFLVMVLFVSCTNQNTGLNLIDDFSTDSRSYYVTNTTTGEFDLPEANWRIKENKYYPAPIDREQQWTNNSATKQEAVLYRKNERLSPGQAISITVGYTDMAWKYPRFGLQIENNSFALVPGNAGYFMEIGGKEYDLKVGLKENREVVISLVRGDKNKSNIIYWSANGSGIAKRGEYEIDKLPEEARFGLVFRAGFREEQRDYYLTNFRYGKMDVKELPNDPVAELTIRSKIPPIYSNKTKIALENKDAELTAKELEGLVEWAINEPGQWSNHGNRALSGHVDLYKVYKVYDKTKDIRILNHLVEIAEMALESRNDLNEVVGHFKTLTGFKDGKWTFDYAPSWPHYMGWNEQDGERLYHGDAGEDAVGVNYMALAARAIAETPAIWDKKVEGSDKNYLETAKNFVKDAIYTVEKSIIPKFIEPETLESIYQYRRSLPGKSTLDIGGYVPFNRFWHVPVAFVSLCPAMEILKIDVERVKTYDKISQVSIQRWLKSMDHSKKEGLDIIDYPYCYPSRNKYAENPEKWNFMPEDFRGFPSEDLNHLGCDASQLYIFHFSSRYTIPVDIFKKYANALLVNAPREGQDYLAYRLDGTGRGKLKTLHATAYFFTQFQPKLKELYWDNPYQDKYDLEKEIVFLKLMSSLGNK